MTDNYNKSAIVLHWVHGFVILLVLVTGTVVLSHMPNDIAKLDSFKIHMILGIVIFGLTIYRIINNILSHKVSPLKVSLDRQKLIKYNHIAIYVVIILVAISGILLSKGSGLGEIVLWGAQTELYKDFHDFGIGIAHSILTKILIFLIIMHIVGVVSYGIKTKENVLRRMWINTNKKDKK
ncbi:MAG: hypothetical protein DRG11_07480 [Epsilonproteobacteria bacterium]|nr:MAG: hypothetical protein DRG11_07480 [Campylobacterota bacterium]